MVMAAAVSAVVPTVETAMMSAKTGASGVDMMNAEIAAAMVFANVVMVVMVIPVAMVVVPAVIVVVDQVVQHRAGDKGGGDAEIGLTDRFALPIGGDIAVVRGAGRGDRAVLAAQLIGVCVQAIGLGKGRSGKGKSDGCEKNREFHDTFLPSVFEFRVKDMGSG